MRRIVLSAFVSLDGVMQAPGGPDEDPTGGFAYGGWMAVQWDDEAGRVMDEIFAQPFDLLLGRRTYDIFAAHWPFIETNSAGKTFDEGSAKIATLFNQATKYVVTHEPGTLRWTGSKALGLDTVSQLRSLKGRSGPDLLVQGSTEIIQTLLQNDLLDEMTLIVAPILLGKGKRLFGKGSIPMGLELTKSLTSPSGLVILRYKRAGEVRTGSFAMETPTDEELARRRRMAEA
jgi:dihydrofolate reductase